MNRRGEKERRVKGEEKMLLRVECGIRYRWRNQLISTLERRLLSKSADSTLKSDQVYTVNQRKREERRVKRRR